jgi:phage terminase small subunit
MDFKNIKPEHKRFAKEYVIDYNATRAYKVAYPDCTHDSAKVGGCRLLTNVNLNNYIEHIQKDLSKLSGVTALRNILELKKLAYTNMSDFKDGWMTEADFDSLTEDQKAALSEIQYIDKATQHGSERIVKFKLHDKHKALELLNKMLGFNSAEKLEVSDKRKNIDDVFPSTDEITGKK